MMEDPLHQESGPDTLWTTVNTAEALPGVLTPLGWTFWNAPCERGMRGAFCDIGVLPKRAVTFAPDADDRYSAAFFGRYAANVDQLRAMGDLMPGTSADALEEQLLGATRPEAVSHPSRRRYPAVMAKMPAAAMRLPRKLLGVRQETDAWWRRVTAKPEADGAAERFAEAMARFEAVMRPHALATMLCQALYDRVATLARTAGKPGLEGRLMTGYGAVEETALVADLWEVSRGGSPLDAFLDRHGYHGPAEGELSSRSWREDPSPLRPLIGRYRELPDDAEPRRLESRRAAEREDAERELLAALSPARRPGARMVLRMARRYIPLREVGKAAFLQTIDAGRAAARAMGERGAAEGVFDDPDDVFYLTAEEVTGGVPSDVAGVVRFRRDRRRRYLTMRLPDQWTGVPPELALAEDDSGPAAVTGMAVSPGRVEGRVAVVSDPAEADVEPGDVLVCATTDPSWASVFLVAAAVVIDIGGPISHGAIVARELGIPCVINTRTGTRQLHTGDLVCVDGDKGTVEVIEQART